MRLVKLPGDGMVRKSPRTPGNEVFARVSILMEQSVDATLAVPEKRTADLSGPLGTKAFTAALCEEIVSRL
jgi:hypothetical protein